MRHFNLTTSFFLQELLNVGYVRYKARVKEQVALSMFLNLSMELSDKMTIPYFDLVIEMAKEINKELEEGEGGSVTALAPSALGKARIN